MKRISTSTKSVDKFGVGKHGFTNGNAVAGIPATDLEDGWFDNMQEEVCAVIEAAGIALDGNNRAQLLAALRSAGVFQTAALGDRTTKPATAAFVQQELGSFSGYSTISASRALTAADIGQALWFGGAGYVLTMPTPSSLGLPNGKAVTVFGNAYSGSVVPGAGANINFTSNNDGAITIGSGQTAVFVVVTPTTWQIVHATAGMEKNADFSGTTTPNNFRRLPGGRILQEGSGNTDANGELNITFPTAFLNATSSYKTMGIHSGNAMITVIEVATSRSLGGTKLKAFNQAGGNPGAGLNIQWIASGY